MLRRKTSVGTGAQLAVRKIIPVAENNEYDNNLILPSECKKTSVVYVLCRIALCTQKFLKSRF